MIEYLLQIKALIDSLIAIGGEVSQKDHIEAIFGGLPQDYDPFTIRVDSRIDPCKSVK